MKFAKYLIHLGLFMTIALIVAPETAGASKLRVVTTIPDLKALAERVGGEDVDVTSLLNGTENAHFADALPTFIRQIASADVVCSVGLELEIGWLPKVLSKSGNAKVQPGGIGHCEVGPSVQVVEKPKGEVDRSMGDVHKFGNPHFQLSPRALTQAASSIAATFSKLKPESSAKFSKNLATFEKDMKDLEEKTRKKLAPLLRESENPPLFIEYHREFSYFFDLYGLKSLGSIEEKPGVPPSAARIANIAEKAKQSGVKLALATSHSPERVMKRFSELSGVPARVVPTGLQLRGPADTIEKVQTSLADALVEAVVKSTEGVKPSKP